MNQQVLCQECKYPITDHGYKCADCSSFFGKEIIYCQCCIINDKHGKFNHKLTSINYTKRTHTYLINSIVNFEKFHLPTHIYFPKIFPYNDDDSPVWTKNHFSEICYLLPNENQFSDSIPFVYDYLRMNNSLKYLTDKLNLKLCSTDVIILILKYTTFDIRLFIVEQLCTFQRAIPIYFGVPSFDKSSMKYYFLMHEMLYLLLPYIDQNIPFILSFGTQSCKEKTLLLNTLLKTNFDCHQKVEFNFEAASSYYHRQLIQLLIGYHYAEDRAANNEITRIYQCHVLDLHGAHDWNQMPNFFIEFMSVIIIHMDVSDINQIDSLAWPSVTFNQTATYLIFIHGEILESDIKTELESKIQKYFGRNKINVHIIRANVVLNESNKPVQLGVLDLWKQASTPTKSLLNVPEQLIQQYNINLSTNVNTLFKSKILLDEFHKILNKLSEDDPSLDLFPLSRLKELSEKAFPSSDDKQQKIQLEEKLYKGTFSNAHELLTKLAQLSIDDGNNMALFEKAVLLWNTVLWKQKREENRTSPISILQKLEMSKERFLREFQERSKGFKNRNGILCQFSDRNQITKALIKIYRHSFRRQEYIEIINAKSHTVYSRIFRETFSNDSDGLKNFFVIGIIGEQSGGKSFLINKVFGTKIAESKFKCTTGILATRVNITGHEKVKNIVILDTEGLLDQSKRNNEAQIFDRQIVLAVMARSHVVMINITRNVNKTMQQILEIVFYGLNKLQITNKPKMIFLFRDQDPKTMGEAGQRNHVSEVMAAIEKSCEKVNFDVQKTINGFDIHEFPSPFIDLSIGERGISFFSNSFCQKALSLRYKVINHLQMLKPFNSFNEWLDITLDLWRQINHNSNLFDFESLVHLTLEKDLEQFSNRILTDANSEMRKMMDTLITDEINKFDRTRIFREIEEKLNNKKEILANRLLEQLISKKQLLMQKQKLESFPEILFENTKSRIEWSLNVYKTDYYMAATRQFQQDEFQKKLSDIPKQLSMKIREIQNVSENADQFEKLFNDSSNALFKEFENMLDNDYKKQSTKLKDRLIAEFVKQIIIDQAGEKYFQGHINDVKLTTSVQNAILEANTKQEGEHSISVSTKGTTFASRHGQGIFAPIASSLRNLFLNDKNHHNKQPDLETILSFLTIEYRRLKNCQYYDTNLLPIPELANDCAKHIGKAIDSHKITDQKMKNIGYTSYGIMLKIFCDEHYYYINNKLISEFQQEISRRKEEVKQTITNVSTAEEHGRALIEQIWTIIQNDEQKQFQDQFEIFFTTWEDYRPSIIAENCVNQLFRSIDYQEMFNYIRNPTAFIKNWLRSKFDEKYESQINQTIYNLSLHLEETKRTFTRMILAWYKAIQDGLSERAVPELTNSLKNFLIHGEYIGNNIALTESASSFPVLDSASIRIIPNTADKDRLSEAISSASKMVLASDNESINKSTKDIFNNKHLRNRLFDRFYSKAKGCGIPCPYCQQICDVDNPLHTKHRAEHHLLWIFGGYRKRDTEEPSLVCCTSSEAFKNKIESLREEEKETYFLFPDHLKQFNPTWEIINRMTKLEEFQLKAYIALEEDLAEHYRYKGRADISLKNKFLRTTITAHCYGLLVGIDYENTQDNLGGIPSSDVSCIEKQLNLSSIAYPENLYILKNDQATKENILNELNTIIESMDERSTFIFYFSGRTTTPVCYLLTSDNKKITADELAAIVGRAKTNKIIIMLDSCYLGGMSNPFRFDSNNYQQGIHILCSSREVQESYQSASDRNGFFTKHLIKGLTGEFSCETVDCNECATRTENLRKADIRKVTSAELALYLQHAITGRQTFSYSAIHGSDFIISFPN